MRSSSSIPAARPHGRDRPVVWSDTSLILSGSTISRRRGMRPWHGPPAIMPFGSMPTMSSTRPSDEKLRMILERLRHGDEAAYVVRCACDPGPDGTGGDTVVDHIRLFPLRRKDPLDVSGARADSARPAPGNIPVEWTDLTVRHTGYVDQALRARKLDRDTKILMRELEERPDDPFVLFNLGAIAVERQGLGRRARIISRSSLTNCGAERLDRAQALCLDRPRAPDAWEIRRRRSRPVSTGSSSTRKTRSCGFARRWCTGIGANRPRPKMLAADLGTETARPILQR